ncbi:hypothetical protein LguiA_029818 [Lonicera macranthoides]
MPKKAQSNDSLHLSPLNPQTPNLYITLTGTFLLLPPKTPIAHNLLSPPPTQISPPSLLQSHLRNHLSRNRPNISVV